MIFDYSYLNLPTKFYSTANPKIFPKLEFILLNKKLFKEFNISIKSEDKLIKILFNLRNNKSYAQAYAGHQFGHFTKLGDGRAIIIGEYLIKENKRIDIQLKGSGKTPYSKNGDGKATLKSMLREYLFSEAMHNLNIPSSRSIGVVKTGEKVHRKYFHDGGILVRIMNCHIRIGTFEYASYFGSNADLKALTSYTINRLYPLIRENENPALDLLSSVMNKQIELVVNWMRVGFIHGVMNTDNTSISGESFDYGPCAFMNIYKPDTSFSSIDYHKRYSFENQKQIIKWNLSRFAECLLPLIHKNKQISIDLAISVINQFDIIWEEKYYKMMLKKIGINNNDKNLYMIVDDLLNLMDKYNLDYNNTFLSLFQKNVIDNKILNNSEFIKWKKKWINIINAHSNMSKSKILMSKYNPIVIPRNNLVEKSIDEAINGNLKLFKKLLEVTSNPYNYKVGIEKFMIPPDLNFDKCYQTYCGT
tara:strand:+ start:3630 stop:5054 length:1425 start_codon:yes stop_codon:yes gene_type:complete